MNLHNLVTDPSKLATYGKFISPEEAYQRLEQGDKAPYLIRAVASDPKWAHAYAYYVIKGRFPEGEKVIASHPGYAYMYADNIKGRFPEGEKAIASETYWAYEYARHIIKGRFPEGERVIASDPNYAYMYVRHIIKGRWPEGEKAIVTAPYWAKLYRKFLNDNEPTQPSC